jgi:ligand-binding SRPBCC domain-containing protein
MMEILPETEEEIYFVDEGIQLPFFLKSWLHLHRIVNRNEHAVIIDDIRFRSPSRMLDILL